MAICASLAGSALAIACPAAVGESAPAKSRLVVTAQHVDSGRMYIEGAIQFLVVKHAGDLVTRRRFSERTVVTLDPGRHWVSSYTRPCDGNCGFLDPPVDRCATYVSVPAHQTLAMTVRISVGRHCSLRLHRRR